MYEMIDNVKVGKLSCLPTTNKYELIEYEIDGWAFESISCKSDTTHTTRKYR